MFATILQLAGLAAVIAAGALAGFPSLLFALGAVAVYVGAAMDRGR